MLQHSAKSPVCPSDPTVSNKFVAAVFEKHLHYVDQYADMLEKKIEHMEFTNKIRIQLYLVKTIKGDIGRILIALALLAIAGKIFGYKTVVLVLFGIYIMQPVQAKKPTTLQGLHNTLLYIRFRINYNWLLSGFGEKQYKEMEAAFIDIIIQLQKLANPLPTTTTTQLPIFQTKDERILHAFVNKTLNRQAEERKEKPNASELTKQQEQMYATE
jgi:hypothetical protein